VSKKKQNILSFRNIDFYIFIFLIVSIPLAFWKGFDNSFDLVKSSVLKIVGGIFLISASIMILSGKKGSKNERNFIFEKSLDPYVLFFLITVMLSVIFSVNPYVSFAGNYERQIGLFTYFYLFLIYMLLPVIINDEKKMRLTITFMEASALIVAVFSVIEYFGIDPFDLQPSHFKRPVSAIGHPIFSAGFLIIIFPFSLLNASVKNSILLKVIAPAVIAAGIIATQTRTAYVALTVEMLIIFILSPFVLKKKSLEVRTVILRSLLFLAAAAVLIILFVLLFPESTFVKRFLSIINIRDQPRWLLWRDSITMFTHYPATGTGIGVFSNVFENFATYELKYTEIKRAFDNAHSNFINTFCTMGIAGGIAYLLVLFQVLRISWKNFFPKKYNSIFRIFSISFLTFISGYIVFGLADFDDITILFYFFVLLSLFKIGNRKFIGESHVFKKIISNKITRITVSMFLVLFALYNIYMSYNEITAQIFFSRGLSKYSANDINGFISDTRRAIELNQQEAFYRFTLASNITIYSSVLTKQYQENKKMLLEIAKEEVIKAEKNYKLLTDCLALRSLIELELGNESEGFRIKDELFKIDTLEFPYRVNLAVYYLNRNNDSAAIREINTVLSWDINNINALITKALYLQREGDNGGTIETCNKILSIEPGNRFAIQTLRELNLPK
jgi:O-Antigen ligase